MNMPTETFLTALYTIIDDWYQQHAPKLLTGRADKKPLFCASEALTLAVAQHWLGIAREREFLRFIRNNYLPLFPRLVDQSQFNRRMRALCWQCWNPTSLARTRKFQGRPAPRRLSPRKNDPFRLWCLKKPLSVPDIFYWKLLSLIFQGQATGMKVFQRLAHLCRNGLTSTLLSSAAGRNAPFAPSHQNALDTAAPFSSRPEAHSNPCPP